MTNPSDEPGARGESAVAERGERSCGGVILLVLHASLSASEHTGDVGRRGSRATARTWCDRNVASVRARQREEVMIFELFDAG